MAKKKSTRKKGVKRKRDYKAEYRRRVARGLRRGQTIQQARGHHPGEKPAKKHRPGKVSKKLGFGKWQTGTYVRTEPEAGFTWDETRQTYIKKIPDLRVYFITDVEREHPYEAAKRLARNAARNWIFFSVRMLVQNMPYGNAVLKFGWTEPLFVTTQQELFEAIYYGYPGSPGYWGLKDDEPDEGRVTSIVALAIE